MWPDLQVLSQCSRLLSMLTSLWEDQEERSRMAMHYTEETFIQVWLNFPIHTCLHCKSLMVMHFIEETFIQGLFDFPVCVCLHCRAKFEFTIMQGFDHNFIHIFQCVLEAVEESLGEDRTEKHFLAFLQDVFEQVQTISKLYSFYKPCDQVQILFGSIWPFESTRILTKMSCLEWATALYPLWTPC